MFSVYSDRFHGRTTASGSRFSQNIATAASNDVPLGTVVKIRSGNREMQVRITDRMAKRFTRKRMDLSRAAWRFLSKDAEPGLLRGHYLVVKRGGKNGR